MMKKHTLFFFLGLSLLFLIGATGARFIGYPGVRSDGASGLAVDGAVTMGSARVEKTTDATLTAAECLGATITNQGAAAEADLMVYALSQGSRIIFVEEEAFVIEVNPPTGEALMLNGDLLHVDDCIDSPGTGVGATLVGMRRKDAAGAWLWDFTTSRGIWVDTGPSD